MAQTSREVTACTETILTQSMTLPPPTAKMKSTSCSRARRRPPGPWRRWDGHDAAELDDVLVGLGQKLHDLVVDAVPFDGATAVGEHDRLADPGELAGKRARQRALAEVDRGGI